VAELHTVSADLPEPAYRQLAGILTQRIKVGEWRAGPLPSVKALQQQYGVGRDTVLHALRLLRDDGVIFTVAKRGSYVSPQADPKPKPGTSGPGSVSPALVRR
jgi:GntR family transcriptional regulator